MGPNGTHRSHGRCHPYPTTQAVKVGNTTGIYVPYVPGVVAHVREGIRISGSGKFLLEESGIQLKESRIPLTIGIQNSSSTRLRVVAHLSSGIVERAKRERA